MPPPSQPVADELPPSQPRVAKIPPSQPSADGLITSRPGAIELTHSQPGASELPPSHTRATDLPPYQHEAACRAFFVPVWSHRAPSSQPGADELLKSHPGFIRLPQSQPGDQSWSLRPLISLRPSVEPQRPFVSAWSRPAPSQLEALSSVSQPKAAEFPHPDLETPCSLCFSLESSSYLS